MRKILAASRQRVRNCDADPLQGGRHSLGYRRRGSEPEPAIGDSSGS